MKRGAIDRPYGRLLSPYHWRLCVCACVHVAGDGGVLSPVRVCDAVRACMCVSSPRGRRRSVDDGNDDVLLSRSTAASVDVVVSHRQRCSRRHR